MREKEFCETLSEGIKNAFTNSRGVFLCNVCEHKNVCKFAEEPSHEKCDNFMDATTFKRYSSIYHFFYPIFDWLRFHYPSEDVIFIVNRNSARMMIEHGPAAFSREIQNVTGGNAKDYNEKKEGGDENESV